MAPPPRQRPPDKLDLQDLLAKAGREPRSEVAKGCIHTLYTVLHDDVLPTCYAALDHYGIPFAQKSPQDLALDLWVRAHDTAPKFRPNPSIDGEEAKSYVLSWITKPAWWIAANESGDIAERLAFELETQGAISAYCRAHTGLVGRVPSDAEVSKAGSACTGSDSYIGQLKPQERMVLIVYADSLQRIRIRPKSPARTEQDLLHTERAPPDQARWVWRVPDGGWKEIGKELKMKPATAKKAVQRAMKRLEGLCGQTNPDWSTLMPPTDDRGR